MANPLPVRNRTSFDLSITFFVASLFCMCLTELFVIRGLWFRRSSTPHAHGGFDLPFLVWIPGGIAFFFLLVIRRRMREGLITPGVATTLSSGLAFLLLLAYLLIARFAQIAFR